MQILSLTSPGVQVFDARDATSLATETNDQVAEAIRSYPTRFAGLAAVAPQDPKAAVREIDRAVRYARLKGMIINSHTRGELLDDPKFWEIFEAAEALNVPIYIHPQAPPPRCRALCRERTRRRVVGLCGRDRSSPARHPPQRRARPLSRPAARRGSSREALPFWLYRLDYMNRTARPAIRKGGVLQKRISEYMRENVFVTTSGMAWAPAITFVQSVHRDGSRDVRDGLPVSVRAGRSDGHRRPADQRRGQEEAVSDQRGARVLADVG